MPDKPYLQIFFIMQSLESLLILKNTKTFNEKLNWLKLYYRRPDLITLVDKYEVKNILQIKLEMNSMLSRRLVYGNKFEDINFNELPNQFVAEMHT